MKLFQCMTISIVIFTLFATCRTTPEPIITGPGSLTVNNLTSFPIAVYAGRIERGKYLGKLDGGGFRSFNLAAVEGIPSRGSLLLRVASMETKKMKNRLTEEDVIYTALVVYNLDDPSDKISIDVFEGIDRQQSSFIYATNTSPYYVLELRLDHPTGDKIATLPPMLENKKIWLSPRPDGMPYRFFPTYIFVSPETNEISSIVPRGKSASLRAIPEMKGSPITPLVFEGPQDINDIGYKVAYIMMKNDTDEGLVFMDGATLIANQKGIRFTPSGRLDTYELAAENEELYTNLKIDHDRGTVTKLNEQTFKPGYIYNLTITVLNGNFEYDIKEIGQKSIAENSRINLFLE